MKVEHTRAEHLRSMGDWELINHLSSMHDIDYSESGLSRSTMNKEHSTFHSVEPIFQDDEPEFEPMYSDLFRDRRA